MDAFPNDSIKGTIIMTSKLKLFVIFYVLLLSGCTSYDIEPLQANKPTDSTLTCEGLKKEYEELAAHVDAIHSHGGTYEVTKARHVYFMAKQRSLVLDGLYNEMNCPEGFISKVPYF